MVQEALERTARLAQPALGRPDRQRRMDAAAHANAVQEALSHGVFRANVSYWADYERLTNEAVQRVLWRGETPRGPCCRPSPNAWTP